MKYGRELKILNRFNFDAESRIDQKWDSYRRSENNFENP